MNDDASNLLLNACKLGDVETAKQAIGDGANVDARDCGRCHRCPLMYAADPFYGTA